MGVAYMKSVPPLPLPMVTFTAACAFVMSPSFRPTSPPAVTLVNEPALMVPEIVTLLMVLPPVRLRRPGRR